MGNAFSFFQFDTHTLAPRYCFTSHFFDYKTFLKCVFFDPLISILAIYLKEIMPKMRIGIMTVYHSAAYINQNWGREGSIILFLFTSVVAILTTSCWDDCSSKTGLPAFPLLYSMVHSTVRIIFIKHFSSSHSRSTLVRIVLYFSFLSLCFFFFFFKVF